MRPRPAFRFERDKSDSLRQTLCLFDAWGKAIAEKLGISPHTLYMEATTTSLQLYFRGRRKAMTLADEHA
jgi:hypothetical protein